MAFYDPRERHIADLHEAFRTESIDRRTFFKVAGAAALATGLSHNAVVPDAGRSTRVRAIRAQPDSERPRLRQRRKTSAISIPTPATTIPSPGAREPSTTALLRYEGKPGRAETA